MEFVATGGGWHGNWDELLGATREAGKALFANCSAVVAAAAGPAAAVLGSLGWEESRLAGIVVFEPVLGPSEPKEAELGPSSGPAEGIRGGTGGSKGFASVSAAGLGEFVQGLAVPAGEEDNFVLALPAGTNLGDTGCPVLCQSASGTCGGIEGESIDVVAFDYEAEEVAEALVEGALGFARRACGLSQA